MRNAQYRHGTDSLRKLLEAKLTYPYAARQAKAHGLLRVRLIISATGSTDSLQILDSPHPSITNQVRQVVLTLPPWMPATLNGTPALSALQLFIQYPPDLPVPACVAQAEFSSDPNYVHVRATYRGTDADLYRELAQVARWPTPIKPDGWYNASCAVRITADGKVIKSKPNKYESVPERQGKLIFERLKNWNPGTTNGKPSESAAFINLAFVSAPEKNVGAPTIHLTITRAEKRPVPAWFPDFINE